MAPQHIEHRKACLGDLGSRSLVQLFRTTLLLRSKVALIPPGNATRALRFETGTAAASAPLPWCVSMSPVAHGTDVQPQPHKGASGPPSRSHAHDERLQGQSKSKGMRGGVPTQAIGRTRPEGCLANPRKPPSSGGARPVPPRPPHGGRRGVGHAMSQRLNLGCPRGSVLAY